MRNRRGWASLDEKTKWMSAVSGKISIKRQKKERTAQNTGAQLEAAALILAQKSRTHRCMNRARIKSCWTENNELRVLLGEQNELWMVYYMRLFRKNTGCVCPSGAKSVLSDGLQMCVCWHVCNSEQGFARSRDTETLEKVKKGRKYQQQTKTLIHPELLENIT